MASQENQENVRNVKSAWSRLKGFPDKCVDLVTTSAREAKNFGKEDPRRIVHSFKVGLAITIVSLFYYFDFLYDGLGVSAMWAVITVVVVFEFSVGATFGRGINRAIATFIGGLLGVAAHRLASSTGNNAEPIVLGFSVFFITSIATFIRLFPKMKERHDYGCMIFILTFCLISVSGYRDSEVIEMAHTRLSTVMIGLSATGLICIFICPVWAGEDLHNLTAANIEKLGISLEAFQRKYFETTRNDKNQENKPPVDGYKVVISSKSKEESLVNFARWEPRHGKFKYRHPWDQYIKIAGHTRECAHRFYALYGYLHSEIPTPPIEISKKIEELCTTMSLECSHALKELAIVIKKMTRSPNSEAHLKNAEIAAKNLKLLVQSGLWPESDPLDVIPAAAVALLLIEIVCSTVKIADSVHRLSILSKFKSVDPARTPARFGVTVE
ncbi:hypothetical protein MIMGU_mgv1a006531mg [Erythranthe guttata]|uniref:Aluminum-activated malate transporter n=1 Tax=Erythranthe guttata TaxID=4155 RepID=A0A022R6D7_ERYGU|nr:PREDICTED: aluminum-activated malate transporter 2-like [Erythranthe guttata]EYU36032.1 hypothetical protein MIMGU_mgv1a006531mg [Erythranthe guttata]|eukprot:XP_012838155.1 PREDICTED: aluminum-activated malate transporter 2-like [Erythranthe guttata]